MALDLGISRGGGWVCLGFPGKGINTTGNFQERDKFLSDFHGGGKILMKIPKGEVKKKRFLNKGGADKNWNMQIPAIDIVLPIYNGRT